MEALRLKRKRENEELYNFRGFQPLVPKKTKEAFDNANLESFLQSQIIPNIEDVKTVQTIKVPAAKKLEAPTQTIEQVLNKFNPDFDAWNSQNSNFKASAGPSHYKVLS